MGALFCGIARRERTRLGVFPTGPPGQLANIPYFACARKLAVHGGVFALLQESVGRKGIGAHGSCAPNRAVETSCTINRLLSASPACRLSLTSHTVVNTCAHPNLLSTCVPPRTYMMYTIAKAFTFDFTCTRQMSSRMGQMQITVERSTAAVRWHQRAPASAHNM